MSAAPPAPNGTARVPAAPRRRRPPPSDNPLISSSVRRAPPRRAPIPTTTNAPKPSDNGVNVSSVAAEPDPNARGSYKDYPLFMTKRALLESVKHHVMRFAPSQTSEEKDLDPSRKSQFIPPVRLQRRNPRKEFQNLLVDSDAGDGNADAGSQPVDDKEKERLAIQKAERQAQREANLAQIAPVDKNNISKKKNNMRKIEQVITAGDNLERQRNWEIRYEEAIPWHIEGDDDTQIWRGNYEAQLSGNHVMIMPDDESNPSGYRIVPVEKWYRFTHRSSILRTRTAEEIEQQYNASFRPGKFEEHMRQQRMAALRQSAVQKQSSSRLIKGSQGRQAAGGGGGGGDDAQDADELDYDYEADFADDEEAVPFEAPDEQAKQQQNRIKREQRDANIFDLKEAEEQLKDYDQEEEEQLKREEEERKMGRRTEKALKKQEKNYLYDTDSAEESDSEASEAERIREEENRKRVLEAQTGKGGASQANSPDAAGAAAVAATAGEGASSSAGAAGKVAGSKHAEIAKKLSKKRPGSPNQSDLSGNESSRKKKKQRMGVTSASASGSATASAPPSRPMSPSNVVAAGKLGLPGANGGAKRRAASAQGSDTEMSDGAGGRTKKGAVKLSKPGSGTTSPNLSRAGSPANAAPAAAAAAAGRSLPRINQDNSLPYATAEEIMALINEKPDGVTLQALVKTMHDRSRKRIRQATFGELKQQVIVRGSLITRRAAAEAGSGGE